MKFEEIVKKVRSWGAARAFAFDMDTTVPMVVFDDAKEFLNAVETLAGHNILFYITWETSKVKGIGVLSVPAYVYLKYEVRKDESKEEGKN